MDSGQFKREYWHRSLAGFAAEPQSGFGPLPSVDVLAQLLLDSFVNTPDHQGKNLEQTKAELSGTIAGTTSMSGAIAPLISDASFAVYRNGEPISAIIVVAEKWGPHVPYLFTHPQYAGQGVATSLLKASAGALEKSGYQDIGLTVNLYNTRASNLYRHLGFQRRLGFKTVSGDKTNNT